ncbi:MAG: response regulator [Gammaproteobacteria bacterium]|nr:response regulator [Gammaproteobacteria bacterium]
MKPLKILIVDDDPGIRELIQLYLEENGLIASSVEDAVSMDNWLCEHEVDIIVLDLMLPGEDGLSIARRLRSQSPVGILMISARSEEIDRIIGLEVGADDYLAKPFNPRELLARIRAISRRQLQSHNFEKKSSKQKNNQKKYFGPFCIDFAAHTLTRDEQPIILSHSEYELLSILIKHPNHVLSRDILMDKLQGYEYSPMDRSIDVCISRLRKKLGEGIHPPGIIETIRSVGYRFNDSFQEINKGSKV